MVLTLFYLGWALVLTGWIWIDVLAFKRSIGWGVLILLIGPALTIYTFMYKTWTPFLIFISGAILVAVAMALVVIPV